MRLKEEGHQFGPERWEPKHPARWCWLKFTLAILRHGKTFGPRGTLWTWEDHNWTCFMRLRHPRLWWPHIRSAYDHNHQHFVDPDVIRKMVEAGQADDPYLGEKYGIHKLSLQ